MDCVFGLVLALGAVLGTVVGLVLGHVNHPPQPRFDGLWLIVVVPIAAYFVGAVVGSVIETFVHRFRPPSEARLLAHDGLGTDPPAAMLVGLGIVFLLVPALAAIVLILFAAGLVP